AKRRTRQPDVVENGGRLIEREQPAQIHDRFARAKFEQRCHIGGSLETAHVEYTTARRGRLAVVGGQAQKPETHLGFVVRGNEGALALTPQQQVLSCQLVDRLAHGALTDLKSRCKLEFAGNRFTRLPFATIELLQQQGLDLLVERAECRAATGTIRFRATVSDGYGHEQRCCYD